MHLFFGNHSSNILLLRYFFAVFILILITDGFLAAQDSDSITANSDSGWIFENNQFHDQFIQGFNTAIGCYPELRHTHIRIRLGNISTTMSARPNKLIFVRSRRNREYLLTIDTIQDNKAGLFFRLSDSARIGLISHELAHVLDYHHHHVPGVCGKGIEYLFHRSRLEHRADELAVMHGMRAYLKKYAEAAFNPKVSGEKYVRFKRKYYYTPEQLALLDTGKNDVTIEVQ
jgi:hypothetical protein